MDLQHLHEHGYVVVEQAVEPEHVRALPGLLREHAGLDVDDPATWDWGNFSASIWNHQCDVRQHRRVHGAFAAACQHALMAGLEGGVANPAFRGRPGWDAPSPWPPARLSALGRRLAGLDPWE